MGELHLACRCGAVRGVVRDATPDTVNRVACHCDDCQTFPHALQRGDVLDALGGTDLIQLPPKRLEITAGLEQLACLRLGPRGMVRWYAACCNSPVANTLLGEFPPFVGLHRSFVVGDEAEVAAVIGPSRGAVQTKYARGPVPGGELGLARVVLRVGRLMTGWLIRGEGRPAILRDASGAPRVTPRVLTLDERLAARTAAGLPPR